MKVKILIALKSFESKQLSRISGFSRLSKLPGKTFKEPKEPWLAGDSKASFHGTSCAMRQRALSSLRAPSSHLREGPKGGALADTFKDRKMKESSLVSIALPKTESNYTILRSPHIDKKSRDQFELKIQKQLIIVKTEINQMREKLFNLKFHEIPGVQIKVVFKTKTRLSSIK